MRNIILSTVIVFTLFSCGSSEDSITPSSSIESTTNGETDTYTLTKSNYSPIQRAIIIEGNSMNGLIGLAIDVDDDLENLITGEISTFCNLKIDYISTEFTGTTVYAAQSVINISNVDRSASSVTITASGTDIKFADFNQNEYAIDELKFSVTIDVTPIDDLDLISFDLDSKSYSYYSSNASGFYDEYGYPNPDPANVDLLLAANILDDPSQGYVEGFSFKLLSATYPPVEGTINGYDEGIRMIFLGPEDPCLISNYITYSNSNNNASDFNTCTVIITKVNSVDGGYRLEGTFSGVIRGENDDRLVVENGTFNITVPEL
jgi:hypothetical protein